MKLKLYICNIDKFMRGEYDHCFAIVGEDAKFLDGDVDYTFVGMVEVDLTSVDRDQLTKRAIEIIDQKIEREREESEAKISLLQHKKQEYLAITYQGE